MGFRVQGFEKGFGGSGLVDEGLGACHVGVSARIFWNPAGVQRCSLEFSGFRGLGFKALRFRG